MPAGAICRRGAPKKICVSVAPLARSACCTRVSVFSSESAMSLLSSPIAPTASASAPATGLMPEIITKTMAKMSSGIPRVTTMTPRENFATVGLGDTFRAARIPTGTARMAPMSVPASAIWSVTSMRYLSATHPSSTSIYSYAIGAEDDLEQAMNDLADLNVMRLATHEVVTINADASIADAVATLSDAHLKKVPVLDSVTGDMVGIVSRSAVNRLAIASYLTTREAALQTAGV